MWGPLAKNVREHKHNNVWIYSSYNKEWIGIINQFIVFWGPHCRDAFGCIVPLYVEVFMGMEKDLDVLVAMRCSNENIGLDLYEFISL